MPHDPYQPPWPETDPPPMDRPSERFMVFYVAPGVCECWKDVPEIQARETVNRLGRVAGMLDGLCVAVGSRGTVIE